MFLNQEIFMASLSPDRGKVLFTLFFIFEISLSAHIFISREKNAVAFCPHLRDTS